MVHCAEPLPELPRNLEGFFCCMMVVGEEHLLTGRNGAWKHVGDISRSKTG